MSSKRKKLKVHSKKRIIMPILLFFVVLFVTIIVEIMAFGILILERMDSKMSDARGEAENVGKMVERLIAANVTADKKLKPDIEEELKNIFGTDKGILLIDAEGKQYSNVDRHMELVEEQLELYMNKYTTPLHSVAVQSTT